MTVQCSTRLAMGELLLRNLGMSYSTKKEKTHSKTKIMASGPITSWQIDGKQWKQ